MNNSLEMFNFSSKLWYNKQRVSKAGKVSLYLQVIINGKHKEFPLMLKWPVTNVDLVNGQLLPRQKKDLEVSDYNLEINSQIAKHTEILRTYRLRRQAIDIPTFIKEVTTFDQRECFLTYIKNEADRRYRKKEIETKTWQNHHSVRKHLMAYDPVCHMGHLTVKWVSGFRTFLQTREFKPGEKYKPGTVWAAMKVLKTYLQLASEEPLMYVLPAAIEFPNPKPKTFTTFCNKDEVRRLMIVYRSGYLTEIETEVLRAFLFTCFTSLRISDVYRVGSDWHQDKDYLVFIPKKNHKRQRVLKIPIMSMAQEFISQKSFRYFNLPSEPEYNRTLKDLAIKAEINKNLTSHVGRHTFGYLFMTTIGNLKALQEILGHSKSETTERYAHLDDDYKLLSVRKIQDEFSDLILKRI